MLGCPEGKHNGIRKVVPIFLILDACSQGLGGTGILFLHQSISLVVVSCSDMVIYACQLEQLCIELVDKFGSWMYKMWGYFLIILTTISNVTIWRNTHQSNQTFDTYIDMVIFSLIFIPTLDGVWVLVDTMIRITFSLDQKKPCLKTDKSLSSNKIKVLFMRTLS